MATKLCKCCFGCYEATESEFYAHQSTCDGLYHTCKACTAIAQIKAREKNKVRLAEYDKGYQQANKKKLSSYHQNYRDTHRATLSAKRALRRAEKIASDRHTVISKPMSDVSAAKHAKVAKWVSENPSSNIKACAVGAGLSWRTAKKYIEIIKKETI